MIINVLFLLLLHLAVELLLGCALGPVWIRLVS